MDNTEFWKRVFVLMENKHLAKTELSKLFSDSPRRVQNLSDGKRLPDLEEAQKIASVLGTTVEYLITGKEPEIKDRSSEVIKAVEKTLQQFK